MTSKLSYANVTATLALFLAMGGVSYAAVHLGKGSVGTAQLKREAVSTAKTRNGAITSQKLADGSVTESKLVGGSVTSGKIADGAVTGAKVDVGTLGTVPAAAHATEADHAARAADATEASTASFAKEAESLDGFNATALAPFVTGTTKIPATNTDAEWWVPVNGMGEVSHDNYAVRMILPGAPKYFAAQFVAFARSSLNFSSTAKVEVQLEDWGEPIGPALGVGVEGVDYWTSPDPGRALVGELAVHVSEEANGEEIPAMILETAVRLVPTKNPIR